MPPSSPGCALPPGRLPGALRSSQISQKSRRLGSDSGAITQSSITRTSYRHPLSRNPSPTDRGDNEIRAAAPRLARRGTSLKNIRVAPSAANGGRKALERQHQFPAGCARAEAIHTREIHRSPSRHPCPPDRKPFEDFGPNSNITHTPAQLGWHLYNPVSHPAARPATADTTVDAQRPIVVIPTLGFILATIIRPDQWGLISVGRAQDTCQASRGPREYHWDEERRHARLRRFASARRSSR